ncbi:MAG: 30S ribosomal protein S27e [Candidatus Marsarchaeota archaeon]|nr:30S ribosomal protein S27e [Candidatus Marsarchaeota archaeon]
MPRDLIASPKSRFLEVKCTGCGNQQTVYSHSARVVKCRVCGAELAKPTGGEAEILGETVAVH